MKQSPVYCPVGMLAKIPLLLKGSYTNALGQRAALPNFTASFLFLLNLSSVFLQGRGEKLD